MADNIGAGIRHTKITQEHFAKKKMFQYILNHILNPHSEKFWKITDKYNKAHWLQKPLNQDTCISNDSKCDPLCLSFINIDFMRDYSFTKYLKRGRASVAYLTSLPKFVGKPQGIPKQTKHFFFEKCLIFLFHGNPLLKLDNKEGKSIFHIKNRGSIGLMKIMFKWVEWSWQLMASMTVIIG